MLPCHRIVWKVFLSTNLSLCDSNSENLCKKADHFFDGNIFVLMFWLVTVVVTQLPTAGPPSILPLPFPLRAIVPIENHIASALFMFTLGWLFTLFTFKISVHIYFIHLCHHFVKIFLQLKFYKRNNFACIACSIVSNFSQTLEEILKIGTFFKYVLKLSNEFCLHILHDLFWSNKGLTKFPITKIIIY